MLPEPNVLLPPTPRHHLLIIAVEPTTEVSGIEVWPSPGASPRGSHRGSPRLTPSLPDPTLPPLQSVSRSGLLRNLRLASASRELWDSAASVSTRDLLGSRLLLTRDSAALPTHESEPLSAEPVVMTRPVSVRKVKSSSLPSGSTTPALQASELILPASVYLLRPSTSRPVSVLPRQPPLIGAVADQLQRSLWNPPSWLQDVVDSPKEPLLVGAVAAQYLPPSELVSRGTLMVHGPAKPPAKPATRSPASAQVSALEIAGVVVVEGHPKRPTRLPVVSMLLPVFPQQHRMLPGTHTQPRILPGAPPRAHMLPAPLEHSIYSQARAYAESGPVTPLLQLPRFGDPVARFSDSGSGLPLYALDMYRKDNWRQYEAPRLPAPRHREASVLAFVAMMVLGVVAPVIYFCVALGVFGVWGRFSRKQRAVSAVLGVVYVALAAGGIGMIVGIGKP